MWKVLLVLLLLAASAYGGFYFGRTHEQALVAEHCDKTGGVLSKKTAHAYCIYAEQKL